MQINEKINIFEKSEDYYHYGCYLSSMTKKIHHTIKCCLVNNNINISIYAPHHTYSIENTHVLNFIHNNYNKLYGNDFCFFDDGETIGFNELKYTNTNETKLFSKWFLDNSSELSNSYNTDYFNPISIDKKEYLKIVDIYAKKFNKYSRIIKAIIINSQSDIKDVLPIIDKNIKDISEDINLYQFVKDKNMVLFLHGLGAKIYIDDFDTKRHSDYYIKQKSMIENIYLSDDYLSKNNKNNQLIRTKKLLL